MPDREVLETVMILTTALVGGIGFCMVFYVGYIAAHGRRLVKRHEWMLAIVGLALSVAVYFVLEKMLGW